MHCTSASGEHNLDLYLKQRDLQMGARSSWAGGISANTFELPVRIKNLVQRPPYSLTQDLAQPTPCYFNPAV